jgi:multiple sugar transport system substrate-binding protein
LLEAVKATQRVTPFTLLRRKYMKSRFLVMALLSLVLVVSFALPAAAQDSLEIYIAGANETTLDWYNNTAFPAFQEAHPGVEMSIITGGWGDFDASVAGWITTGDGPDIIYLGSEYAATFGDLLTDMDPYLADWEELDSFIPAALDTVTYDGHLRGLPILQGPRPYFYRSDLAADPATVPPLTFTDAVAFTAANSEVVDGALTKQGYLDFGSGLFDAQEFIGLIWSAGGELYNEDGTSAFNSEATAEALQFMYDRRRAVLPNEQTAGLPPFEGSPIASGAVVSAMQPMWAMPAVSDPIWDSIVIAPFPAGANGAPIIQNYIDWLAVPAYVENPELAAEFLKFITSRENAIALTSVSGYTPVRTDAWDELKASSPVWAQMLDLAVEYGRAFSDIRASAELRPLITEQVTAFLTDQQSLEDTQEALKEEYDGILDDNGYLG